MNIGILYIGIGEKYFSLYHDFKESFDKFFLPNHNKYYFIITDKEYNYVLHENETRIIVEDEGWPYSTLKRFEYFLKCDTEGMDYLFYFNGNAICQHQVNDEDIIPNEKDNWLCGCWASFLKIQQPYDENPKSACYLKTDIPSSFRGGLLGGRINEFIKMCKSCVDMIEFDLSMNYIPKWHDEAYFNKYVYYLNIKKIKIDIFSYFNFKKNYPKIYLRNKEKIFGKEYLINHKGKDYYR